MARVGAKAVALTGGAMEPVAVVRAQEAPGWGAGDETATVTAVAGMGVAGGLEAVAMVAEGGGEGAEVAVVVRVVVGRAAMVGEVVTMEGRDSRVCVAVVMEVAATAKAVAAMVEGRREVVTTAEVRMAVAGKAAAVVEAEGGAAAAKGVECSAAAERAVPMGVVWAVILEGEREAAELEEEVMGLD
jgi:hypothetical protein